MRYAKLLPFSAIALFIILFASLSRMNAADKAVPKLEPVEADMHEFMEYAFEPFYKSLRESMKSEPADKRAWKPVKANSLVLAENGNLLMMRGPDGDDKKAWNALATDMREHGRLLYQQAKKRDYTQARKHYETFITKCNACHEKFADGKHMLKP
jgi:hypothetical protein